MTICTRCDVCNAVVRYTSDARQIQEAIDHPKQFCEGHISEPSDDAIKAIMSILRRSKNPDNRFFIAKDGGRLMSHAYLGKNDGSYFPSIPKGSYEIGVGKNQSRSYAILKAHIDQEYHEIAKEAWVNENAN